MLRGDDPYADPSIYDILHTPGSQAEAAALLRVQRGIDGRAADGLSLLEPACGSGRLLRPLSSRVGRVHGFDLNHAMLQYARRRLPEAHLFRADMENFRKDIPAASIDLAVNTINTIRHLATDAALQRHFEEIDRCLAPDGLYLVGLSLCDYDRDEPSEDQWSARRGRLTIGQLIQYIPPPSSRGRGRVEEIYAHVRIERPRGSETRDHRYGLRAYDAKQWQQQIARSPLRCVGCYDDRGGKLERPAAEYSIYALAKGQSEL